MRLDFIHETLQQASATILRYYQTSPDIEHKVDASPVTIADREVEAQIRRAIVQQFPDEGIYGEEGETTEGTGGVWIIDPIDGTKSFLCHNPLFGSLLGYQSKGRMRAGGVVLPALNQVWLASTDQPTTCNGDLVRVSGVTDPAQARLATTAPDYFSPEQYARFEAVSAQVQLRQFGGDCTLFTALAGGGLDIVLEAGLAPYDYLPLVPIIEAAGGMITDWQGNPLGLDSHGEVLASSSAALHQWALGITA